MLFYPGVPGFNNCRVAAIPGPPDHNEHETRMEQRRSTLHGRIWEPHGESAPQGGHFELAVPSHPNSGLVCIHMECAFSGRCNGEVMNRASARRWHPRSAGTARTTSAGRSSFAMLTVLSSGRATDGSGSRRSSECWALEWAVPLVGRRGMAPTLELSGRGLPERRPKVVAVGGGLSIWDASRRRRRRPQAQTRGAFNRGGGAHALQDRGHLIYTDCANDDPVTPMLRARDCRSRSWTVGRQFFGMRCRS